MPTVAEPHQVELVPVSVKKRQTKAEKQAGKNFYSEDFERVWAIFPSPHGNKKSSYDTFCTYRDAGDLPDLEDLIMRIKARSQQADWIEDDHKWVPNLQAWLNKRGWEDPGCEYEKPRHSAEKQATYDRIFAKYNGGNPGPNGPWDADSLQARFDAMLEEMARNGISKQEFYEW